MYCVWQVVKTPTFISNNPVYLQIKLLPEGIITLAQWWGLRGQMILRTMLAVALLPVGPPMPDSSEVTTEKNIFCCTGVWILWSCRTRVSIGFGMRLTTLRHTRYVGWEASEIGNKDDPARTRIYEWEHGMCCLCIEVMHYLIHVSQDYKDWFVSSARSKVAGKYRSEGLHSIL